MQRFVIPPQRDAAFVAALEALLDVYAQPPDPRRPLVCFDEAGKELQAALRPPLPMTPGHPRREDPEYVRHGSANLFLAIAPHLGQRQILVTERRTRFDFAAALRHLVDEVFPDAVQLRLVLDNLNTHRLASLYHAFPPAEALRIARKLEWHYTPKHGSWLNLAELELSVLSRQCLHRRLPDRATLETEIAAWVADRNAAQIGVDWRFTIDNAREALPHVYPHLPSDTFAVTDH
jgi:DDE superfamily endonuclease